MALFSSLGIRTLNHLGISNSLGSILLSTVTLIVSTKRMTSFPDISYTTTNFEGKALHVNGNRELDLSGA
jgi:hypothetical protein